MKVWQKSIDFVNEIYKLTAGFPKSELFGLTSQMRRAAVTISSNIAEGQKRAYTKGFLQFLYIAYGSGGELETQIEICKRLPSLMKLDYSKADTMLLEIMKMLNGLIGSLKNNTKNY